MHFHLLEMSPLKRHRAISTSEKHRPPVLLSTKREIYTRGRPPWLVPFVGIRHIWFRKGGFIFCSSDVIITVCNRYTLNGTRKEAFLIGLTGGSASGKTTVAAQIIERLDLPWVIILSMDSFYKVRCLFDIVLPKKGWLYDAKCLYKCNANIFYHN